MSGRASSSNHSAGGWMLLGGFIAGLNDFVYPTVKTMMAGEPWTRPWKGVASGLLGRRAQEGGMEMVALGAGLHWFINIAAAFIFYGVIHWAIHWSRGRLKFLPRHWLLLACIHGLAVLITMNYVILPLSAIGRGIYPLAELHIHAFWHILLVGLPVGYCVARALRKT